MKTAVSIPDDLFGATDAYARRTNKSRSQVVSEALHYYLVLNDPDQFVEAVNQVVDTVGPSDSFVDAAARRVLEQADG